MLPIRVRQRQLGLPRVSVPLGVPFLLGLSVLAGFSSLGAAGCSPQDFEEVLGDVGDAGKPPAGTAIPFQTFDDDVGTRASSETRILIRTSAGYVSVFGHGAPADIDFRSQWVIFYAAGTRPTGGYDASVLSITRVGNKMLAITQLASPGSGCAVTDSLTTPHVLVKFAAQPGVTLAFDKSDTTHDCDTNPCAAVLCPVGSICKVVAPPCIPGASCPLQGTCVPDPSVVHCGGIAGRPCPDGQQCVDDPSDGCDPNKGGADCGGICVGAPPPDPCATVSCMPGSHCELQGVTSLCVTAPCPPPVPTCVPDVPKVFCGGIAGVQCAGFGKCVDDPSDDCDPNKGGADCGGICQCVENVACIAGKRFDSSPDVCSCVPDGSTCGPVCDIFCQYGHQVDANGCLTCACNPAPPTPTPCPTDKCPRPSPLAPNIMCSDGKTIGGPACVVDAAGVCNWTIIQCPAVPPV